MVCLFFLNPLRGMFILSENSFSCEAREETIEGKEGENVRGLHVQQLMLARKNTTKPLMTSKLPSVRMALFPSAVYIKDYTSHNLSKQQSQTTN